MLPYHSADAVIKQIYARSKRMMFEGFITNGSVAIVVSEIRSLPIKNYFMNNLSRVASYAARKNITIQLTTVTPKRR